MRKGLMVFIILCLLISLTVGCRSNSPDTVTPTQMQDQLATPELSMLETEGKGVNTEPEATASDSTSETNPSETEPSIQETEPEASDAPTELPRETAPPVTEEPEQTDPQPTQPKPTEPAEILDLNALMQYGRDYAASVHGYEACPGLRDGYYPAYTCVFDTLEAGKAAIRGCIDDTTRALLARPGGAIFTEIDGVIYRARIDVVVVPKDEGTYLVSVFYG